GIRDFHVTGVQTCALPISVWLMGGGMVRTDGAGGDATCARRDGLEGPFGGCSAAPLSGAIPRRFRHAPASRAPRPLRLRRAAGEIGRASCRERGQIWEGVG